MYSLIESGEVYKQRICKHDIYLPKDFELINKTLECIKEKAEKGTYATLDDLRKKLGWSDTKIYKELGLLLESKKIYKQTYDGRKAMFIPKGVKFSKEKTPKKNIDPALEKSFDRVNEKYFYGMILKPNLVWGGHNFRSLGSYDYTMDTIRISKILEKESELVDYIMYHEMLHKKLKYKESNSRNIHHTSEFKKKEKDFDVPDIEKRLNLFLKKQKLKNWFGR